MEHEQINKLNRIINTYGIAPQEDMAIEECSELIKALLKCRRNPSTGAVEVIIDEIADVKIILQQLEIIYGCQSEVENRVEYKINRQIERIEKESRGKRI